MAARSATKCAPNLRRAHLAHAASGSEADGSRLGVLPMRGLHAGNQAAGPGCPFVRTPEPQPPPTWHSEIAAGGDLEPSAPSKRGSAPFSRSTQAPPLPPLLEAP